MARTLTIATICGSVAQVGGFVYGARALSKTTDWLTTSRVSYLSEVEEAGKEKRRGEQPSDPRAHALETEVVNAGPANYEGFIDGEGFDGGDGQVGVVGDGTNAMETFDTTETIETSKRLAAKNNAVGGAESKQLQKNVWGFSTGYADDLARKGMVDIDEYGEDRLKARRQQLENYRNQGQVRAAKDSAMRDLAALQGKEHVPARHGSYLDGFERTKTEDFDIVQGATRNAAAAQGLVPGDRIYGTLKMAARLDSRGGETVTIDNEFSTYSDFVAGIVGPDGAYFTVEPASGTLNRRGGVKTDFVVRFMPTKFQPSYEAKLVIQIEDHTWTYDCLGVVN